MLHAVKRKFKCKEIQANVQWKGFIIISVWEKGSIIIYEFSEVGWEMLASSR